MQNSFRFGTLVRLRQDDTFFSLLKKDKMFELFLAFLHEAYDEKENKALAPDAFLGMLGRFLSREAEALSQEGVEADPDSCLRLMLSDGYNLVERVWDTAGGEYSFVIVPTANYTDAVRLIEERSRYTVAGSALEIRDTIEAVRSAADTISGDAEKQKEALRQKIAGMQKELDELERTGKAKPLSAEEVRQTVAYVRHRLDGITGFLSRGTAAFREERDSYWEAFSRQVADGGKMTTGSVAEKVLSSLDDFRKSDVALSYEHALELLTSPDEQQVLTDSLERIMVNPDARKALRDDDVNMRAVLRKVARDSRACYEIMRNEVSKLNAYMRSGEAEKNRLLYRKADELLLSIRDNKEIPLRRHLFRFRDWKAYPVCHARSYPALPKEKLPLVHAVPVTDKPAKKDLFKRVWRDITLADIPGKFQRLLKRHSGKFTLALYMEEEGTSLGLYEFLAVRKIMCRYMGRAMVESALSLPVKGYRVTDLAPRDGSGYKENFLTAHDYWFDERGYEKWKKNSFRI